MKTILVPVDFSHTSHHALGVAFRLADQLKSAIKIIHISSEESNMIRKPYSVDAMLMANELQYELMMVDIVERQYSKDFPNVDIEWDIIHRSKRISQHIADEMVNCDLLVMGTNGANQVLSKILGSTTSNVIDLVDKPVLAVPADSTYDGHLDQILHICDFQDYSDDSLSQIQQLFQQEIAPKITCLDINTAHNPHLNEIASSLSTANTNINFKVIDSSDEIMAIRDYTKENKFDLIAISTNRRNWLQKLVERSFTEQLLLSTDLTILAL